MPPNINHVLKSELVSFSFEVAGVKELDRSLGLMIKHVKNLKPAWPDVKDDFIRGSEKLFNSEGRSGGTFGRWRRLSPQYKVWKDVHFPGRGILVRTGALRASLMGRGLAGSGGGFIYKPGKMGLSIGSSVPYAIYHQTGNPDLPKRKPIDPNEAQKRRWMKILHEYIFKSGQGFIRRMI
jgi:hypothetical protein